MYIVFKRVIPLQGMISKTTSLILSEVNISKTKSATTTTTTTTTTASYTFYRCESDMLICKKVHLKLQ